MQSIKFEDVPDEFGLSVKVYPIVPSPGEVEINFDMVDCMADGPSVGVVEDSETKMDAIELADNSRVTFPVNCKYQYMALNVKNLDKFVAITVTCKCSEGKIREVVLSNRRSNIAINGNSCQAPLLLGDGWQYLNVDIEKLLNNAFGASLDCTLQIAVTGSTRLGKLYLQESPYADAELPPFLRLIQ
jgi:hypothetical protein